MRTDIPDDVRRAARTHDLGEPEDVRHETSAGAMIGVGLGTAGLGVLITMAVMAVMAVMAADAHGGSTHLILPTGVFILGGLALALRGMVVGTRSHYLFTGGLVARRRAGVRVLTWSGISAIETLHRRESGAVIGYRFRGAQEAVIVPLKLVHDRDAFMDRALDRARARGASIR